ncbi:uncharacterized protein [Apostichopus japonicus]
MTMMRCVTLLLLVATFAFGHHGDSDDHDHHTHGAEVITTAFVNNEWLFEFHAPEGEDFDQVKFVVGALTGIDTVKESHFNHYRWSYAFEASNFNPCDEVNLLVEGENDGTYRQEFHGDVTLPGDDC